jgi:hypothetical protein
VGFDGRDAVALAVLGLAAVTSASAQEAKVGFPATSQPAEPISQRCVVSNAYKEGIPMKMLAGVFLLVGMLGCASSAPQEQAETSLISLEESCRPGEKVTLCNDTFSLFNSVDVTNIRLEKKDGGYVFFAQYRNAGHDKKGFVRVETLHNDQPVGLVVSKVFDLEYRENKAVRVRLPRIGNTLRLTTVMWND